jgi:hypothetical protein
MHIDAAHGIPQTVNHKVLDPVNTPTLFANLSFEFLGGYMAARYVQVGARVGLFRRLASSSASLPELARDLGMPERTTRILADALVAVGVLRREGGRYHNGAGAALLGGWAPLDLLGRIDIGKLAWPWPAAWTDGLGDAGRALRLWREVVEPQWADLETALREDRATFHVDRLSPEQRRLWSEGIALLTAPAARALAHAYPFGRHRRLLDLGGGAGSFALAALRRHPRLVGTLFELPRVAEQAREQIVGQPAADRLAVAAGDFFADPIPPGHDAILLANVAHLFGPERNLALLRRVRGAAAPGARLLFVDFWTNRERTVPAVAALMAGSFQTITGEGDVYSADEARGWLETSGWRPVARHDLASGLSLVVAEAVV